MLIIKVDCIKYAESYMDRLMGYMFQKSPNRREIMIFNRCNSVHTFNMRFKLDILFLDDENRVIKKSLSVGSRRFLPPARNATKVVEAAAGLFATIDVGEIVSFDAPVVQKKR